MNEKNQLKLKGLVAPYPWGDINTEIIEDFLKQANGEAVEILINSGGGSVFEGIDIFNTIKSYTGEVTTVNTSINASIASLIALSGDKRKAHDNSAIMIHKSWNFAIGNDEELKKEAELLSKIDYVIATEYSKVMGKGVDEILNLMSAETWYMGEKELLESGLIEEVISTGKKDDKKSSNSANLHNQQKKSHDDIVKLFSAHAEDLNLSKYEDKINACFGKCDIKNNQGEHMPKKVENTTTTDENAEIVKQVKGIKADFDNQLASLNKEHTDKVNALTKEVDEGIKLSDAKAIVSMGLELKVSGEVLNSMLDKKTEAEASLVALASFRSTGATVTTQPNDSDNGTKTSDDVSDEVAKQIVQNFLGE